MKQQLLELVEAYADAKGTQNQVLQRMAVAAIHDFLGRVELTAVKTEPPEQPDREPAEELCEE